MSSSPTPASQLSFCRQCLLLPDSGRLLSDGSTITPKSLRELLFCSLFQYQNISPPPDLHLPLTSGPRSWPPGKGQMAKGHWGKASCALSSARPGGLTSEGCCENDMRKCKAGSLSSSVRIAWVLSPSPKLLGIQKMVQTCFNCSP